MILSVKVKNEAGKGIQNAMGEKVVALNKVIREACTEKVTPESRPEESDHVGIQGKNVPDRDNGECKSPEMGLYLAY